MTRRHVTIRDTLVVLLTLTTGAVDATSFLALGRVFSSVITGNLVLLGLAAGTGSPSLAEHAVTAVAGYSAGVLLGAPVAARVSRDSGTWPPAVTATLAVEACLLVAFSAVWEVAGGHPGGGLQMVLDGVLAASMGAQSAAVRRLGEMSTTYLTGTLTGVLAGLATRDRPDAFGRSVGVLVAIVAGAVTAAFLITDAPTWLPVAILLPIGAVVTVSLVSFEHVRGHLLPRRFH